MSGHQYATINDTVYFWFGANDTSGSGGDGASPVYDVREAGAAASAIPLLSGSATLLTHANYPAGCHEVAVAATTGNGFAANDTFAVFCTLLVDSQNPTGFVGSCTLTPLAKTSELDKVPKSDGTSTWNTTALASIEAEALDALQGVQLDHLCGVTTGVAADGNLDTYVVDGSVMSHLLTAAATTVNYNASTDSQQAVRDYVAPSGEYDTQLDANMTTRAPAAEYDTEMARITANVGTAAELDKVPKSDGTRSWNPTALNAIESEVDQALQSVQLDHLCGVTTGVAADGNLDTHVVDGSILSHLLTAAAVSVNYKASTDSLQAVRDRGDAAWITGGDATEAKQDTIIAAIPTVDEIWDAIGSDTSLSFETIVERTYQFFVNELRIVDATGGASLQNFATSGVMATWTIDDDDTFTDRTAISWV